MKSKQKEELIYVSIFRYYKKIDLVTSFTTSRKPHVESKMTTRITPKSTEIIIVWPLNSRVFATGQ